MSSAILKARGLLSLACMQLPVFSGIGVLVTIVFLPRPIHRGFRLLSSLPRLGFSSHRGEFGVNTFGKDEVLPRAHGSVVSSGTVSRFLLAWNMEIFMDLSVAEWKWKIISRFAQA